MEFRVVSGGDAGQVFSADVSAATIGRGSGNLVALNDPKVSRQHARLEVAGDAVVVEDLGSTNGTYVNGQRLAPHVRTTLRAGDQVRVGDTTLRFEGVYGAAGDGDGSWLEQEASPARGRPRWLVPAIAVLALVLVAGGAAWLLLGDNEGDVSNREATRTAEAPVILVTPSTATPVTFRTVAALATDAAPSAGTAQPSAQEAAAQQGQAAAAVDRPAAAAAPAAAQGQPADAPAAQAPGGQGQLPAATPNAAAGQGQLPAGAPGAATGQSQLAADASGAAAGQGQLPAGAAGQALGGQGQLPGGSGGQGFLPGGAGLEQLPALASQLFPGVPAEQLPQVMALAAQSGQLSPAQAQPLIAALFPGVPPAQLPQAIQTNFPGVPPDQLQAVLNLVFPGQNVTVPGASPLSGRIFYGTRSGDNRPQIYQINADGSGQQLLIDDASEPAVSPDRQWLAYYSWRNDARGLRLRNLATGEDLTLTSNSEHSYPTWAPDQKRLAFYDYSGNSIQTIAVDGSDQREIATGEFPAWSPRGDRIAYKGCIGSGNCGIILAAPDGSNPAQLTTNANDGQPAWSPDGNALTFVSNRDGNWEIYAINADGSWLRRITDQSTTDGLPEWAADGTRIAFRSDRGGAWAIWVASGVGGPATKLVDAPTGSQWQWEKISWR